MQGEDLPDTEELIRALIPPRWDQANNRISASAFVDTECSVSRTSILPYESIEAIFIADLHNPPHAPLKATVAVTAGAVREACVSDKAFTVAVQVVADPIKDDPAGYTDNPAHALILGTRNGEKQKISRGMSNAIIKRCAPPVMVAIPEQAEPPQIQAAAAAPPTQPNPGNG
jgi:hypothetical protein